MIHMLLLFIMSWGLDKFCTYLICISIQLDNRWHRQTRSGLVGIYAGCWLLTDQCYRCYNPSNYNSSTCKGKFKRRKNKNILKQGIVSCYMQLVTQPLYIKIIITLDRPILFLNKVRYLHVLLKVSDIVRRILDNFRSLLGLIILKG